MLQGFATIVRKEGVGGLYAGLGGYSLKASVDNFTYFFWRRFMMNSAARLLGRELGGVLELVISNVAGILHKLLNLPLDVVQELLPETWRPRLIGLRFLAPILAVSLVEVTHVNLESRAPVKEVLDMMIAVGKTVVAGPTSTPHFSLVPFRLVSDPFFSLLMVDVRGADADRPQPYIGPGYETVTDLMSVGIGEDDLEVCTPSRSTQ